jgi:hypothetical protein
MIVSVQLKVVAARGHPASMFVINSRNRIAKNHPMRGL